MKIKICDKCKATNVRTLLPKLKSLDNDIGIEVKCHNFCGIGMNKSFALLNNKPVIALNEDELVQKIREKLN